MLVLLAGLYRHCTVFGKVLKSVVTVLEESLFLYQKATSFFVTKTTNRSHTERASIHV